MKKDLPSTPPSASGHGLCAELLARAHHADEWGIPDRGPRPVPLSLDRTSAGPSTDCPPLALKLLPRPERKPRGNIELLPRYRTHTGTMMSDAQAAQPATPPRPPRRSATGLGGPRSGAWTAARIRVLVVR